MKQTTRTFYKRKYTCTCTKYYISGTEQFRVYDYKYLSHFEDRNIFNFIVIILDGLSCVYDGNRLPTKKVFNEL